jgi:hypothetical protein
VRECERLVELDRRLPDLLAGKATPANPAERIELGGLCFANRMYRAAARFYEEAFADQPGLADQLGAHRYKAACAAALAGSGLGGDADKLGGPERARLRKQALDWLRADLLACVRLLDTQAGAASATKVMKVLQLWERDAALADVCGPEALAKLPEAERHAWQQLWDDIDATLARVVARPPREKKAAVK